MSFLLMVATIPVVISLRLVVSSVAILISLRVMVSTMTVVISFRVVISTVTTTMTRPMPVMMSLILVVVVVAMVIVIENRPQCDKRNRRRNNAVIMIRASWCAGQCQGNQAANRHDSKLVGLQFFHFNLHFISTMAAILTPADLIQAESKKYSCEIITDLYSRP